MGVGWGGGMTGRPYEEKMRQKGNQEGLMGAEGKGLGGDVMRQEDGQQ